MIEIVPSVMNKPTPSLQVVRRCVSNKFFFIYMYVTRVTYTALFISVRVTLDTLFVINYEVWSLND